jgi:hypothetical protein
MVGLADEVQRTSRAASAETDGHWRTVSTSVMQRDGAADESSVVIRCKRRLMNASRLAVLLLIAATLVPSASAANRPAIADFFPKPLFRTPGAAAYCYIDLAGFEDDRPDLLCWTPNDGWGVEIASTDRRAFVAYHNHAPRTAEDFSDLRGYRPWVHTLGFGSTWSYRCKNVRDDATCIAGGDGKAAFICRSRSIGLTCTNAVGHGFWIGRFRGYRLF